MRDRQIDKKLHRVSNYETVDTFLAASTVNPGISTVYDNDIPIDILVSPTDADTTIVFFHGAIEKHFTLPVLSGLGISGGLEANRVFVSDPSLVLDETLLLAWYAGNHRQPSLQRTLTAILKKVVDSLGSTRTIFFGGSGGGFAALYFAHQFDNSLALVFNPQTDIAKYSKNAVNDFATKSFNLASIELNLLEDLPDTVTSNLCHLYASEASVTVAYLQNRNDKSHVTKHLQPMVDSLHPTTDFLLLNEPWREGHTPPPKDLLTQCLNLAVETKNWVTGFQNLGFVPIHGDREANSKACHT